LAVSLALAACRETERPLPARPQPTSAPPPAREQPAPHDDFHQLLAKPSSAEAPGEVPAQLLKAAVERSNAASFDVWRALKPRENLTVSPYSIRSALGLLYLASLPGSGRSSLQARLHYPARNEDLDIGLLHGIARTAAASGFGCANALWVARPLALSPAYLAVVSRSLPAEIHAIDFAADPARADRMINAWASERTRGQIPSILEEGSSQAHTRSVLVDTAYVAWDSPAYPGFTRGSFSRSFSTSQGTTVKADMMACSPCVAVSGSDYQAAVDYHRGNASLAFVVIMPKRWREFRWNEAAFRRVWADFAHARLVALELPKVHVRSRTDLGAVMSKLDLDLVDPQGLLASGEPFSAGALVHEASVQIDEATLVVELSPDLSKKLLGERLSVRFDRPFYFLLFEPRTRLVLLMGQVTDPTAP
jgi:serpin B